MSDKPKPGKDKDLRLIRQALEDADALFGLFGGEIQQEAGHEVLETRTEALLLIAEQIDLLDQMLADPTTSPMMVIEQNRQVRTFIRSLLPAAHAPGERHMLARLAYIAGNQLKALLVVKEIRHPY
jgi:hypothetical protein